MTRFVIRRLLGGLVTLFLFVTALFFLGHLLIPGDFVTQFTLGLNSEELLAMREELSLTQSVFFRYWMFAKGLVTGDLGDSYWGQPVTGFLFELLPWTLLLLVIGLGSAFAVGLWLGRVVAWRRPSRGSTAATMGAIGFHTVFPPLLVFVLVVGFVAVFGSAAFTEMKAFALNDSFVFGLGFIGPEGVTSASGFLWVMLATIVGATATALWLAYLARKRWGRSLPGWVITAVVVVACVVVWSVLGIRAAAFDALKLLSLPLLAVFLLSVGEMLLVTDGAMSGVCDEAYVFVARAKGLRSKTIRDRHAGRVALLPMLSRLVVSVPYFLAALMIIEYSFLLPASIHRAIPVPGVSLALFSSLEERNIPVVIGALFGIGIITLVLHVGLDIAHGLLDPRIRVGPNADGGGGARVA